MRRRVLRFVLLTTFLSGTLASAHATNIQVTGTETNTRVLTTGDNITIADTGHLSGTDWGIYLNSIVAGTIINNGSISVSSFTSPLNYTRGHGIYMNGYSNNVPGGIYNYGSITGLNSGLAMWGSAMSGPIHNYGSIIGLSGNGLYIDWQTTMTGQVINHEGGVIWGGGPDNLTSGIGMVLYQANLNGGLINQGTLGGNVAGIYLYTNSTISGGIQNSGTIVGASGIVLENGTRIAGGITNNTGGLIQGITGPAIDLGTLAGNTPININGGRIIGNVVHSMPSNGRSVVTVNGDFTTEGNFNVSNLTVTSGHTLTISPTNSVTLYDMAASTGGLTFSVGSNSQSLLTVTNGDVDVRNMTLGVNAGRNFFQHHGDFLVADGLTKVNGGNGQATTSIVDNSLLWNFRIADGSQTAVTIGGADNTQLYIIPTQVSTIAAQTNSTNNRAISTILDNAWTTSDPQLAALLGRISTASTAADLNKTLEAAKPIANNSALNTSSTIGDTVFNMIDNQLSQLHDPAPQVAEAATDDMMSWALYAPDNHKKFFIPSGNRMWGQTFGEIVNQNARQGIAGYKANTGGFVVGMDTQNIDDRAVLGVSASFAQTDVNGEDANQSNTNIDSYQFSLYGDYNLAPRTYVSGMAGYQYGRNKTERYAVGGLLGLNAQGEFDSQAYIARTEIGHHFKTGALTATPSMLAHYTHYTADSYSETGAGGAGLADTGGANLDKLEVGAGLKLAYAIPRNDDAVFTPSVHGGYRYDVIGDKFSTTSRFAGGGSSFTTNGADPAQGTVNAGVALDYTDHNIHYTAHYDYEHKSDYNSHAAFLRVAYKF